MSKPSKKRALLLLPPQNIYKNTCSEGFVFGVIVDISELRRTERTVPHLHVSNVPPIPTANNHRNFILPEMR
jgi:hypothetical protein